MASSESEKRQASREEIRSIGPKGEQYLEHMDALVDSLLKEAEEHEIPVFLVVGLDRPGDSDNPATLTSNIAARGDGSQVFCSDTLKHLLKRLCDVVSGACVAIPREVAELLGIKDLGAGIAVPLPGHDQDEGGAANQPGPPELFSALKISGRGHQGLPAHLQAEATGAVYQLRPEDMSTEGIEKLFAWATSDECRGCDCELCQASKDLAERVRRHRKDMAN